MKDLLLKFLKLIPAFFEDFFPLVTGPKRFVAKRLSKRNSDALQRALTFLLVSFLISWLIEFPFNEGDIWQNIGPEGAFVLSYIVLYGGALYLAWRTVGGKGKMRNFFIIFFYYAGIIKLLMSLTFLGIMGSMRAFDPELYDVFYSTAKSGNLPAYAFENYRKILNSPGFRLSCLATMLGFGAMIVWIIAGWGAFRKLHQVSKLQSMAAGFLFCTYSIPVVVLTFFIANGLVK